MPSRKKITPEEAVANLKSRKHSISKSAASAMIKKFKSQNNKVAKAAKSMETAVETTITYPAFLSYGKKAIVKILNKKECVGLRLYPALNAENEFTIIMVGIDENNNNMVPPDDDTAPAVAKSVSKKTASLITTPVAEEASDDILDEGQASPPYPPPNGGL